jgi:hypothetical protein
VEDDGFATVKAGARADPSAGLASISGGYVNRSCRYDALICCHPPLQTSRLPIDILNWETAQYSPRRITKESQTYNCNTKHSPCSNDLTLLALEHFPTFNCSNGTRLICHHALAIFARLFLPLQRQVVWAQTSLFVLQSCDFDPTGCGHNHPLTWASITFLPRPIVSL